MLWLIWQWMTGNIEEEQTVAILTLPEKVEIARAMAKFEGAQSRAIGYDKPIIFAVIQAIEDQFETVARGQLRGAISAAAAPFIFTDEQRDAVIALWMKQKVRREGF